MANSAARNQIAAQQRRPVQRQELGRMDASAAICLLIKALAGLGLLPFSDTKQNGWPLVSSITFFPLPTNKRSITLKRWPFNQNDMQLSRIKLLGRGIELYLVTPQLQLLITKWTIFQKKFCVLGFIQF